jgi:hypothetical protein
LAAEAGQRGLAFGPEMAGLGLEMRAIDAVAQQGMADMGQVHPDLMGAPGLELAGELRRDRLAVAADEGFLNLPVGDGLAAALAHRHFLPRIGMPVDRGIDAAALPVRQVPYEGDVAAPHRAGAAVVGELLGQRFVGLVVLGRHHQPGGILVEPVHDARAPDAADPGKADAAMGDQRVDQRAGLVAGGRMHDEALGLVDDDDVVILMDNIQRDRFAGGLGGDGLRHVDCDRIAGTDMISGVADGGAFKADGTCQDQRLQPRARQLRNAHREHAVEPDRALVAGDDDLQPLTAIRRRCLFQKKSLDCMTEIVAPEPTPEQAALFARVRRLMLIAGLTTALAVTAVLIAIGYRLFRTEGSVVATDTTAMLPKGARIVATGVAGDRLVVTLEIAGATEIRTFDAKTLKAAGRLQFVSEP